MILPNPTAVSSCALASSRWARVRVAGSYSGRGSRPSSPATSSRPLSTSRMWRCQARARSCSRSGTVANSPHCGTAAGVSPTRAKSSAANR
ncbi:hypothetical protein [Kitasatospora albolonga]|uniref:hypothetical protein n=1 Tax=Kitasatospora albolonga TaxID=68173 RepID=UPI0031EE93C2